MANQTNRSYDVAIIGGGIGGLMAAYRLTEKRPSLKILLVEKGPDLKYRSCPMVTGKAKTCVHCRHCSIMEGLAGAPFRMENMSSQPNTADGLLTICRRNWSFTISNRPTRCWWDLERRPTVLCRAIR